MTKHTVPYTYDIDGAIPVLAAIYSDNAPTNIDAVLKWAKVKDASITEGILDIEGFDLLDGEDLSVYPDKGEFYAMSNREKTRLVHSVCSIVIHAEGK